jgi:phage major head subunit gpT-like protein
MVINASNLDALFITFSKQFADAYMTEAQPLVDSVGARVASNTRDQRYPIVQSISGAMRQWTGERQVNNIVNDGLVVTNLKWENTLAIERTDLEDDQYGVYSSMLIPNLARHARLLPELEVAKIFNTNPTCYDGVSLFSASHPKDPSGATPGTQSNTLSTKPINGTNLAIAMQTMMSFVGPDNIPMGSYGNTLLVPPSCAYVAWTLANGAFYPEAKNAVGATFGAQDNIWKGQFNVVVSPYLTDTGDPTTAVWYLLDTRSPTIRPVFWQERSPAQLVSMVDPSNPSVFFEDRFYMGARMRGAASAGIWFKALKISGA